MCSSRSTLCAALKLEHFNMRRMRAVLSGGFSHRFLGGPLDLVALRTFAFNLWGMSG